jgi:hypothetical protein
MTEEWTFCGPSLFATGVRSTNSWCCVPQCRFYVVTLACANMLGNDKSSGRVRAARVRTSLRFLGLDIATCILLNGK